MRTGEKGVIQVESLVIGEGFLEIECSDEAAAEMLQQLEDGHMEAMNASGVVEVTEVPLTVAPFGVRPFDPKTDDTDG